MSNARKCFSSLILTYSLLLRIQTALLDIKKRDDKFILNWMIHVYTCTCMNMSLILRVENDYNEFFKPVSEYLGRHLSKDGYLGQILLKLVSLSHM